MPICTGGFLAKRGGNVDEDFSLDRLLNQGFELVNWDGRTPHLLLDKDGRIITVLAGRPNDPTWDASMKEASWLLEEARHSCVFTHIKNKRRGNFQYLNVGVSYGGGQIVSNHVKQRNFSSAISVPKIWTYTTNTTKQRLSG